jgi:hypothetical protein
MNDRFANRRWLPLAACVALAFASARVDAAGTRFPMPHGVRAEAAAARAALRGRHEAPPRGPVPTPVTSCTDDGTPGELRAVIGDAISGDTIDLSALTCSTITLTQGAIAFGTDLMIHGPDGAVLTIEGNGVDSIFVGYGTGTTAIDHLTIAHGRYDGATGAPYVFGGCAYFTSAIQLYHVTITDCSIGTADIHGYGGALFSTGNATIQSSTISASTGFAAGGVLVGADIVLVDSTVSGNYASYVGGGLSTGGLLIAHNSTVAFNSAGFAVGGVFLQGFPVPEIESSIIADNSAPTGAPYAADLGSNVTDPIAGSHDLIVTSNRPLPADTIDTDPMLAPLADNGGLTPTHALMAGSPAIDTGDNIDVLPFDQRGDGYPRLAGVAPDIGAFERGAQPDPIFANGFDPGA